jgi:hypothetical protein
MAPLIAPYVSLFSSKTTLRSLATTSLGTSPAFSNCDKKFSNICFGTSRAELSSICAASDEMSSFLSIVTFVKCLQDHYITRHYAVKEFIPLILPDGGQNQVHSEKKLFTVPIEERYNGSGRSISSELVRDETIERKTVKTLRPSVAALERQMTNDDYVELHGRTGTVRRFVERDDGWWICKESAENWKFSKDETHGFLTSFEPTDAPRLALGSVINTARGRNLVVVSILMEGMSVKIMLMRR